MKQFASLFLTVAALAAIASCAGEPKLTPSQVGSKWGYVNPKGELVIEPAFEAAENFSDELAKVVLNGKVGYIGTDGLFRVTADYLDGTTFFEDKAFVIAPGETPLCIDKTGRVLFSLPEDVAVAYVFSGDIAKVETYSAGVRYVDKSGNTVATPAVYQPDNTPGYTYSVKSDAYYAPEFKTTMHSSYGDTYDMLFSSSTNLGNVRSRFPNTQVSSNNKLVYTPAVSPALNGVTLENIVFTFDGPVMGAAGGGRNQGYFGKYKSAPTSSYVTSRSLMNAEYHFTLADASKGPSFVRTLSKEISDKTASPVSGLGQTYTIPMTSGHPGYNIAWIGDEAVVKVTYAE